MSDQPPRETVSGIEEQSSSTLRAELKEWERSFSIANGGRKPGRDDIKNNPAISAKYKAYSRLRAQSSQADRSPAAPPTQAKTQRAKRKRASDGDTQEEHVTGPQFCSTPRKKPSSASKQHIPATPSRGDLVSATTTTSSPSSSNTNTRTNTRTRTQPHPSQLDPYDSPSTLRKLFSPSYHNHLEPHYSSSSSSSPLPLRAVIGPTPQRDGKALGLFDLLSVSGGSSRRDSAAATPSSRRPKGFDRHGDYRNSTMRTPSGRKRDRGRFNADGAGGDGGGGVDGDDDDGNEEYENFFSRARTPASSAKKFYLANFFATPPAYRYSTVIDGKVDSLDKEKGNIDNERGPEPNNAPGSCTPSFLRRRNLFSSSSLPANPRQHHGGILQPHDLSPVAVRMPQKLVGRGLSSIVQGLRDIQEERLDEELDVLREMEAERDNVVVVGGADDADGRATSISPSKTRQWKKKGQKRTTRRVIMKPVRTKPNPNPTTPEWPVTVAEEDEAGGGEGEDELAAILETQPQPPLLLLEPGANKENESSPDKGSTKEKPAANNSSELNYATDSDLDPGPDDNNYAASPSRPTGRRKEENITLTPTATATTTTNPNSNANVNANANPAKRKQATATKMATKKKPASSMDTVAEKQKRKPKQDAHANYRALKIRGKGSHARGGGRFAGARFGRRR
ncbi:hypothetical protein ACJ72_07160 [Emergomyces africanus]|uniref:DNA replication regulator SLD2 n=1 Tax=Emergomyces africanus TaxID=1955775 RepID=A0A1B7NNY9_9EURO|nr:hypothetical protein ACJ72_07160 [Emergomyces africanus]